MEIVKIYHQNQCSIRQTFRALRLIYGQHDRPAESTIRRLINKFERTRLQIKQHLYVDEQ